MIPRTAPPDPYLREIRLDVWLWAARWFKARKQASDAVRGGHILLGGARAKPGRVVRIGDAIELSKGPYRFHIQVTALSTKRLSAKLASALYEESEESQNKRAEVKEALRLERLATPEYDGKGRPTKKDAREMRKVRNR